MQVIVVGCR